MGKLNQKKYRQTTVKYYSDPPKKDESLIHFLERTKNTLRCLLYYDITPKELFVILGSRYHMYPCRIKYKDPYSEEDYLNEFSDSSKELLRNNGNISNIIPSETHGKLKTLLDAKALQRSKIKNDLATFRRKRERKKNRKS